MEARSTDRLVVKDYPLTLWVIGAVLIVGGLLWILGFLALQPGGFWPAGRELAQPGSLPHLIVSGGFWPGAVMFLIGAPMALLSSALTITADRLRGTLTLQYRSLVLASVKELPVTEIASVEVDRSSSTHSGRTSTTYRVILALASGGQVPLRSYYSSGYAAKERIARQLREFLGVTGLNMRPVTAPQAMRQVMTPSFTPTQEGTTEGVAWRLENAHFGGIPVSRWFSAHVRLPDSFLCLMQRPPDPRAAQGGGGLAGMVSQMLYRQVLSMYGIDPGRLPGFDTAGPVEGLDSRLAPSFASLTNNQAEAWQCLNPWVIAPLAQWIEDHPMKTIQGAGEAGQLIVLFSPEGLSATWLNAVAPEQQETITRLGVDLARAQGAASAA